jgi:hypothetical protein
MKDNIGSLIIFFVLFYLLISFGEFGIHKYIMHNKINLPFINKTYENHITHHINVNSNTDFSLKNNNSKGICFGIDLSIILFIILFIVSYILFHKLVSIYIILITCLLYIIYNKTMWNLVHSYIHHVDVKDVCSDTILNIPKKYINENNMYINWIIKNHQAHHYYKDKEKGNYNILIPGADYILGTHKNIPV